jgi:hypothetical protein
VVPAEIAANFNAEVRKAFGHSVRFRLHVCYEQDAAAWDVKLDLDQRAWPAQPRQALRLAQKVTGRVLEAVVVDDALGAEA